MKRKNFFKKLKNSKSIVLTLILTLSTVVFSGCSSDDEGSFEISVNGPVISVSDFSGNWNATEGIFRVAATPNVLIDVIALGGSITFNVQSDGRFTITIKIPDRSDETYSGRLGFNAEEYGNALIVLFDGDAADDYELFNVLLEGGELIIAGPSSFDFDDNGIEEEAILDFVFERS